MHTSTRASQCTCCDVISRALRHVRTYPAATQKGVVNLCLYQYYINAHAIASCNLHVHILVLRFSHYLAIANKVVHAQ